MPPTTQTVGWRTKVQGWLQAVEQHRRIYGTDLKNAALSNQGSFPRSILVSVIGQLFKSLAVWMVKSALRDAASSLNIDMDAETLDFLANLAAATMLAS